MEVFNTNNSKLYNLDNFKSIPNNSDYCINEEGIVYSFKRNRFLLGNPDVNGYPRVYLYNDGIKEHFYIHSLMKIVFMGIDKRDYNMTINHIDENPLNNHISNLEYVSRKDNTLKYYEGRRDLPLGVRRKYNRNGNVIYFAMITFKKLALFIKSSTNIENVEELKSLYDIANTHKNKYYTEFNENKSDFKDFVFETYKNNNI